MSLIHPYLKKCSNKFKNKFDYSNAFYKNCKTKVEIRCKEHGVFFQVPEVHFKSKHGCPFCANQSSAQKQLSNTESFVLKAKKIHKNKYSYLKTFYKKSSKKVIITCKLHGDFEQIARNHLSGKGCKKCAQELLAKKFSNVENFIFEAKKKHGEIFDYSKVKYKNSDTKIIIVCPKHGNQAVTPYKHLNSIGCPLCGVEQANKTKILKRSKTIIEDFAGIHKNKYDYSKYEYMGVHKKSKIICEKHGEFFQSPSNHLAGNGCPKCSTSNTLIEKFVENYLRKNNIVFLKNDRKTLNGKELDFYIANNKVAIECNGLYWHSELAGKDKNYHLNKTLECKKVGVFLIQIFEHEIKTKAPIVISRLNSIFKINKQKIHGRKCNVRFIDKKIKRKFVNKYHIQGDCGSIVDIGLFYKNRLVSVMTFGKQRISLGSKNNKERHFELLRYCSNFRNNVVGGAGKMLAFFEKNIKPNSLISYCDFRWSFGNLYKTLGFKYVGLTKQNYWYFKGLDVYHRFSFRKSVLEKKLENFDKSKSEHYNMLNNGWNFFWDCGNLKFIKNYDGRN